MIQGTRLFRKGTINIQEANTTRSNIFAKRVAFQATTKAHDPTKSAIKGVSGARKYKVAVTVAMKAVAT